MLKKRNTNAFYATLKHFFIIYCFLLTQKAKKGEKIILCFFKNKLLARNYDKY